MQTHQNASNSALDTWNLILENEMQTGQSNSVKLKEKIDEKWKFNKNLNRQKCYFELFDWKKKHVFDPFQTNTLDWLYCYNDSF